MVKMATPVSSDIMRQRSALSAARGAARLGAGKGAGADMGTVAPILKESLAGAVSPGIADQVSAVRDSNIARRNSPMNPKAILRRGPRVATDTPLQRAARRKVANYRAQ